MPGRGPFLELFHHLGLEGAHIFVRDRGAGSPGDERFRIEARPVHPVTVSESESDKQGQNVPTARLNRFPPVEAREQLLSDVDLQRFHVGIIFVEGLG